MAVTKKAPKKDPEIEDQDLELEEEEEEEEEEIQPKKKPAAKKSEEDTPQWAKTIINLLTPKEQEPVAKIIPTPKAPAPKIKEEEEDHEKNQEIAPPKQTFLGWFW